MKRILLFIFITGLFVQCSSTERVIDWERKKLKWMEKLSESEEDYHKIVSVPLVEEESLAIVSLENEAKLAFASEIMNDLGETGVDWGKELNLDGKNISAYNRSRLRIISARIENMALESIFKTDQEIFGSFKINKKTVLDSFERMRLMKLSQAKESYAKAQEFKLKNLPWEAAESLSNGLLAIQDLIGENTAVDINGTKVFLDKLIYDEMKALRVGLSFQTNPSSGIILNSDNSYKNVLSFNVDYNGEQSGAVKVDVDVAGINHDQIHVNEYDILVGNLPIKLNKSVVVLKCDLFEKLRTDGNELIQLLYRTLSPLQKRIEIKREFPPFEVLIDPESEYTQMAVNLISEALEPYQKHTSGNAVKLTPYIEIQTLDKDGYVKLKGKWIVNIGDNDVIKSQSLVSIKMTKEKALSNLMIMLRTQLDDSVIHKILKKSQNL